MLQETFSKHIGHFIPIPVDVAVAVSGGSDSMALLLLVDSWAKAHGVKAFSLTVDHGLRTESAGEASQVAAWCKARNIAHYTLLWKGKKPKSGKQEAARAARYDLLVEWCKTNHVQMVMTAHHLEDQGETLFFRLARGSGIRGLACMPTLSTLHGITLLRPLLGNTKKELVDFLEHHQQPWIDDPSNISMDYTRNIIRKNLADTNLSARAGKIANAFGKTRNLLENKTVSYLTKHISVSPAGFITVDYNSFIALPIYIAHDVLETCILHISGNIEPLRSAAVKSLRLSMLNSSTFKRTALGGCLISYNGKNKKFIISRELKTIQTALSIASSQPYLWDKRFSISCNAPPTNLEVRCLGAQGISQLNRKTLPSPFKDLPAYVLHTFPSFWCLEELVCVPHIGYYAETHANLRCCAEFTPAKSLAASAFYGMNDV